MSYVRWSTIINADMSTEEWVDLISRRIDLEGQLKWCKKNKNPECYLSDWYIFWHSISDKDSNQKEDQHLAMWNCGEQKTPVLDYKTVKQMLETDDWSPLGYKEITQKEVLIDCVKRWLDNVDRDCK